MSVRLRGEIAQPRLLILGDRSLAAPAKELRPTLADPGNQIGGGVRIEVAWSAVDPRTAHGWRGDCLPMTVAAYDHRHCPRLEAAVSRDREEIVVVLKDLQKSLARVFAVTLHVHEEKDARPAGVYFPAVGLCPFTQRIEVERFERPVRLET